MQNIFIVPAMQHGCRAKPLLISRAKPGLFTQGVFLSWMVSLGWIGIPFMREFLSLRVIDTGDE